MRRRTTPPRKTHRHALAVLADLAAAELAVRGAIRQPAGPWLEAGRVLVVTAQGCGWEMTTTPAERVERELAARGWGWRWEGEELVLEMVGWISAPSTSIPIQQKLLY